MSKYSLQKRVRYARYENGKNIMHLICHETSIQIFPIECKLHQHLVRDGNPLPHYMATPEQNPGVDPTRTATMDAGKIIELLGRPENYPAWLWHSHFATWPSHGPVESSWIFPIDSMAHLSSSLHSYVNLYQRLLRCSYGFPMVFPLKAPFSRGYYCLLFQQAMPPRLPISVNEAMAPQKEGVSSVAWRATGKWSPWRGHTMWGPPVMLVGL